MADVVDQDGRRGLSRRQMIKASAVAGAAAWTAPVIIDSVSSPALGAVASGCSGNSVTLSWIYVLYRVGTSYFITGFSGGQSTCGGGGSNPNHGTLCVECQGGTSFTLNQFNGPPPIPGSSVANAEALYTTAGGCAGTQSNAWTFVGAPACGTHIVFNGGQIMSQGGAVIIAAIGFGGFGVGGKLAGFCPNDTNTGNSVCGIE